MTVDTHIRVLDPISIDELFDECRRLLHTPEHVEINDGWDGEWVGRPDHSARMRWHWSDQGLAAWLIVYYAVERPLPTLVDEEELHEIGEPVVPHFALVKLESSADVADNVHSHLVTELAVWLGMRGKRFDWRYNGGPAWHDTLVNLPGDPDRGADYIREEATL